MGIVKLSINVSLHTIQAMEIVVAEAATNRGEDARFQLFSVESLVANEASAEEIFPLSFLRPGIGLGKKVNLSMGVTHCYAAT